MSAACPILGFIIGMQVREPADEEAVVQSLKSLLDLHGLAMARAPGRTLAFAVTRDGGQATNTDRELALDWAARHGDRGTFQISDVVDLSE